MSLEIFLAAGAFCDEVLAFARAQSALQFIVMGWPEDASREKYPGCAAALKSLHEQIGGEILLVRGQGKVTRLTDLEHHLKEGRAIHVLEPISTTGW